LSALAFLLVAVAISAIGSLILWLTHRQRPPSIESGIQEFSRELKALAPDDGPRVQRQQDAGG
jgi:hypothetical protein